MPFGPKQFNNPTPRSKSVMMDFLGGFLNVLAGFLAAAPFIPKGLSDPVSITLNLLVIPTIPLLKRMFGEEMSNTKVIGIDQVTEIKDK